MSVANSGLVSKPFIVKSYPITAAVPDQVDTDVFSLVVPALTASSYSGNIAMQMLPAAGQSVVDGNLFTRNFDNSPIPVGSPLFARMLCVPQVSNPQSSPIIVTGFLYNQTTTDFNIKFMLNVNVSNGVSSIATAGQVYFYPVNVDGFRI